MMADGRHFENSFISISQPRIIRFRSNLVGRCTAQFPSWIFNKKSVIFQIQDGGRTPYWKSIFLAISRRHIGRSKRNLEQRWKIACGYRSHNKIAIFSNSRWRTAAILKIALSPYLSGELSDIDQIWQADVNLNSHHGFFTKICNFSNSRWRTDAIFKIVF